MRLIYQVIPAHFWLILAYVITALVNAGLNVLSFGGSDASPADQAADAAVDGATGEAAVAAVQHVGQRLESDFNEAFMQLPLFTGESLGITVTAIFIFFGFIAQWVEAFRATQVRRTGGNDFFSILLAFAALLLFVGAPAFHTTAFLVVVIVGFGDVLLDRLIGQAVARRDFGGLIPGADG